MKLKILSGGYRGALSTGLNNYDIEVVIPESEPLSEVLGLAEQDSML